MTLLTDSDHVSEYALN